jgi:hypothetical protein
VRRTAQLRFRVPGHIWHPFETHPGLCLASIFGQHHQKAQQMSHPYHKKKTCQITNGKTTNQTPRVKNSQDSANFFLKKNVCMTRISHHYYISNPRQMQHLEAD